MKRAFSLLLSGLLGVSAAQSADFAQQANPVTTFQPVSSIGQIVNPTEPPEPPIPYDDAGDRAFVAEAMMVLLGRRPKNADELEALTNIVAEAGRESVARLLMEEDEFLLHWSDVLLRLLRVQQTGTRFQLEGCFGDPLRVDGSGAPIRDGGALAENILNTLDTQQQGAWFQQQSGTEYNAVDVAISGLQDSSVWPLLKVYSLSLLQRSTNFRGNGNGIRQARREKIGRAFFADLLNRNPDCLGCHQTAFSATDAHTGWDRHFPVSADLEGALLDDYTDLDSMFAAFRKDVARLAPDPDDSNATANEVDTTGLKPWGLSVLCGTYNNSGGFGPIDGGYLAGELGNPAGFLSLWDVEVVLHDGALGLAQQPLEKIPGSSGALAYPGDSIPYLMALNLVDRVWEEIYGTRLTLDHGFPRNAAQRDVLRYLTDAVFLPSGGPIKALLLDMLVGKHAVYFNRIAPNESTLQQAESLPPVFDPWAAEGNCPAAPGCANAKGTLVRRYSVDTLLRAAASAMGWKPPKRRFAQDPAGGSYPSGTLMRDLDAFLSEENPGSATHGFQSLLAWESNFGQCEKSGKSLTSADWIDRLMSAIEDFPEDHPDGPLTMEDIILIVKDRLISAPYFGETQPFEVTTFTAAITPPTAPLDPSLFERPDTQNRESGGVRFQGADTQAQFAETHTAKFVKPTDPTTEERGKLRTFFFNEPLSADPKALIEAQGAATFEARLRGYCGVLLKSPQSMLGNLGIPTYDRVHRLKVCNPGEPCSYTAWCNYYTDRLAAGQDIDLQCMARYVQASLDKVVSTRPVDPDPDPRWSTTSFKLR